MNKIKIKTRVTIVELKRRC